MDDIQSRYDIERLVDLFYAKVFDDDLLSPIFAAVDWKHHKPIMYDFWSSLLLGDQRYQGNPFKKHIDLPIKSEHFDQWLKLFTQTVNDNFSGEVADEAKNRAHSIAGDIPTQAWPPLGSYQLMGNEVTETNCLQEQR